MSTLPPELEREIFEITVLAHLRNIPSLLQWAKPFHWAFQLKPNVVADGVQHVYVFVSSALWLEKDMQALWRLCGPRLVSLAGHQTPEFLPTLSHLSQLHRWSGNLASLFGSHSAIDLSISPFRFLTHMHVEDEISAADTMIFPSLVALPCLTHLCLHDCQDWQVPILSILAQCLHLQVLVSMPPPFIAHLMAINGNPPTTDVHFVVCLIHCVWADSQGGTDFWAEADEFVVRKRRGEIEGSCLFLEPSVYREDT
ncbi:hypothetical protein K438DRAFT_1983489 [Mycena galopus ATCC 62051]|nr:hypothetical protein K438DRAFT_1983489 [Mycena galopus ATCC 62051]